MLLLFNVLQRVILYNYIFVLVNKQFKSKILLRNNLNAVSMLILKT